MDIKIGEAIIEGFERTLKPTGIILASVLFITSLVSTVSSNTLIQQLLPEFAQQGSAPLTLGLSVEVAAALSALVGIANLFIGIVAIRTLAGDATERIPRDLMTRNMLPAALNTVVGGIAFSIAFTIGLVLLIVPGLYLATALYFWTFFVALEDQNFIEAFRSSWELTRGRRLEMFALLVVLIVLSGVFSGIFSLLSVAGLEVAGLVASTGAGALAGVFVIASLADAYNQLRDM